MSVKNSRLNKKIRRDEKVVKAYRARHVKEVIWEETVNKYGHIWYKAVVPSTKN